MFAPPERPARAHEGPPTLAVRSLGRAFGGNWAFRNVTFEWRGAGVVGLRGANGSGKTSLLRVMAQLLLATEGRVELDGCPIDGDGAGRARERVGFVPHQPLAYRAATVRANLRFGARVGGTARRDVDALVDETLRRWGLQDVCDAQVASLSRGWQQRYTLARADLHHPPILLLDEPTTGLDAAGRDLLDAALEGWRRTRLLVVSSHEGHWLDGCADEQVVLDAPLAHSRSEPAGVIA